MIQLKWAYTHKIKDNDQLQLQSSYLSSLSFLTLLWAPSTSRKAVQSSKSCHRSIARITGGKPSQKVSRPSCRWFQRLSHRDSCYLRIINSSNSLRGSNSLKVPAQPLLETSAYRSRKDASIPSWETALPRKSSFLRRLAQEVGLFRRESSKFRVGGRRVNGLWTLPLFSKSLHRLLVLRQSDRRFGHMSPQRSPWECRDHTWKYILLMRPYTELVSSTQSLRKRSTALHPHQNRLLTHFRPKTPKSI